MLLLYIILLLKPIKLRITQLQNILQYQLCVYIYIYVQYILRVYFHTCAVWGKQGQSVSLLVSVCVRACVRMCAYVRVFVYHTVELTYHFSADGGLQRVDQLSSDPNQVVVVGLHLVELSHVARDASV